MYDAEYQEHVRLIRKELEGQYPTLHLVGRNGMHRYNNQDHAMMTAMLTVRNILAGRRIYNIWEVNEDAEYHERGNEGDLKADQLVALASVRHVPCQVPRAV